MGHELVAHVACADEPSNVSASSESQPREHELAVGTADLGVGGRTVVRGLLGQAPDHGHRDPSSADRIVPVDRTADCLVTAAALGVGARLATGNPKDFPMKELAVESPPPGG